MPAASKKSSQASFACLHLRFLQLSHLSDIFLLQSSFALTTASLASLNFFSAASKAALTAFAAASKAYKKEEEKKKQGFTSEKCRTILELVTTGIDRKVMVN